MSLESWKREHYPIRARMVPAADALQHSLVKWRGLRPEVLAKHRLIVDGCANIDEVNYSPDVSSFNIDAGSCALCKHFADSSTDCKHCPLAISRDGIPCDQHMANERYSPYGAWTYNKDPEPMIAALEKALSTTVEESQS